MNWWHIHVHLPIWITDDRHFRSESQLDCECTSSCCCFPVTIDFHSTVIGCFWRIQVHLSRYLNLYLGRNTPDILKIESCIVLGVTEHHIDRFNLLSHATSGSPSLPFKTSQSEPKHYSHISMSQKLHRLHVSLLHKMLWRPVKGYHGRRL